MTRFDGDVTQNLDGGRVVPGLPYLLRAAKDSSVLGWVHVRSARAGDRPTTDLASDLTAWPCNAPKSPSLLP